MEVTTTGKSEKMVTTTMTTSRCELMVILAFGREKRRAKHSCEAGIVDDRRGFQWNGGIDPIRRLQFVGARDFDQTGLPVTVHLERECSVCVIYLYRVVGRDQSLLLLFEEIISFKTGQNSVSCDCSIHVWRVKINVDSALDVTHPQNLVSRTDGVLVTDVTLVNR